MRDLNGLRICFIAGTLGRGGAERQLYYMLRVLRENGAEPRVLCLTSGEFWESPIRDLGVAVTWVGERQSRVGRLRRILEEVSPASTDIVQSQHFYTNLYATIAARTRGLPEIGAIRNDGINEVGANRGLLGLLSLRAPRLLAANSRTGMQNAALLGAASHALHFLPNVVDTCQFSVRAPRRGTTIRLLSIGRMVRQKRFDRFIRVLAAAYHQTRGAVQGAIVGDGPDLATLRKQAGDVGLSGAALTFHGLSADIRTHYQSADVLVMSSDWEGTPNVALEAMASGLPVVATRVGGLADIVRHGETGLLVEPSDERALIDAIVCLACDAGLLQRFSESGRAFVEQHHALGRLRAELSALYGAALGGTAGGNASV